MTALSDIRKTASLGTKIPSRESVGMLNGGNDTWIWDICAADTTVNHSSIAILCSPILPYLAAVVWEENQGCGYLTLGFGEFTDPCIGPDPVAYIMQVIKDFNANIRIRVDGDDGESTSIITASKLEKIDLHLVLPDDVNIGTRLSFRCEITERGFPVSMYSFITHSSSIAEPNDTMWCSFNTAMLQATTGCVLGTECPIALDSHPPKSFEPVPVQQLKPVEREKKDSMRNKKAARRSANRKARAARRRR